VTALQGVAALANGDARSAADALETAMLEYGRLGSTVGTEYFFGIAHVQALALRGNVERAQHALTTIQHNRHHGLYFLEPSLRLAEAWVAAVRGRFSRARAVAAEAAEFAGAHGQYAREVSCLQAAIQFGSTRHAARLSELARLVDGPRSGLVARWAMGLAEGDGVELLCVSEDLETMGDRIAAADAAAHASLAFQRQGRRGAALTAAGRASSCVAQYGFSTPAIHAAAMPLSLSERERETAVLVSNGMSNKEIAATMMVSVRTVEGHVLRACRKLGVANRAELASVLNPLIDGRGIAAH
jgi:DNA-binding CsgD family transcriptional regulator